jgi:hypothetical protein
MFSSISGTSAHRLLDHVETTYPFPGTRELSEQPSVIVSWLQAADEVAQAKTDVVKGNCGGRAQWTLRVLPMNLLSGRVAAFRLD